MLREQWELPKFRRLGPVLATEATRGGEPIVLLKPQTYMNRSGVAVAQLLESSTIDPTHDLLVLVDDLALPLGTLRLRARGSSGGHNGLESIEAAVGSQDYARLRIGIGPPPEDLDDQADFVTEAFEPEELRTLADLLPDMVDAVECWLAEGIETAMNRFNRRGTQE